ncbi:hypothetical protein ANO11243_092600 [Dothideomycetidae sp. 11243]|nr:hypothetical protein ANO11243_092600 [fungal sp. No.11243]
MASTAHVFTGFWVNHMRNSALGLTLTLHTRYAGFLTSALTFVVTMFTSQMWVICAFIAHQLCSTTLNKDAMHHQTQAILANHRSVWGTAAVFTKQLMRWRNEGINKPKRRALSWSLLVVVLGSIFSSASIFTGFITSSTGSTRLLTTSGLCGYSVLTSSSSINDLNSEAFGTLNNSIQGAEYAKRCCSSPGFVLGCDNYVRQCIDFTKNINATCPFPGLCYFGDTAAVSIDTGLIDSRDDLGINTWGFERVFFQKVTTCAPLHLANFVEALNSTVANGTHRDEFFMGTAYDSSVTFAYETVTDQLDVGYAVTPVLAQNKAASNWIPLPEFNKTDGDVTAIFITAGNVKSDAMIFDPVFNFTLDGGNGSLPGGTAPLYYLAHEVSVIGCVEQYRVCQPNNGICTPFDGAAQLLANAGSMEDSLDWNLMQIHIIGRLANAAQQMLLYNIISGRGDSALQATGSLSELLQAPLPNDQWINEVTAWSRTGTAILSQNILDYVSPAPDKFNGSTVEQPDAISKQMCGKQLTDNTSNTVSFSVLGGIIILAVGIFVTLLAFALPRITGWVQKKWFPDRFAYKHYAWKMEDVLHVQMQMYQGLGMGGEWVDGLETVPKTQGPEVFGGWAGVDAAHPSLFLRHGRELRECERCRQRPDPAQPIVGVPGGHVPGGNAPGGNAPGGNAAGGNAAGGNVQGGNMLGGQVPGGNAPAIHAPVADGRRGNQQAADEAVGIESEEDSDDANKAIRTDYYHQRMSANSTLQGLRPLSGTSSAATRFGSSSSGEGSSRATSVPHGSQGPGQPYHRVSEYH